MYDVSHKKEKLSMCMYDVIVKKAKIMRQKHKNMFESAVLIVKRAKTRAITGTYVRVDINNTKSIRMRLKVWFLARNT